MRVPIGWLNELTDAGEDASGIAEKLTMAGLEVEGVERSAGDYILEVNVTPNRPDCLNILGMARELSAITGTPLKLPETVLEEKAGADFTVEITDKENCHRYAGRIIRGVAISESPDWIIKRLEMCGMRPVNNVVDITNYALLEFGHPLHAFDLDKLRGGIVKVASAGKGQKLKTIDGIERALPENALLIWDAERPVAVAGVMGGMDTEVNAGTKNVFLESAWFKPQSVRKTSKTLGLSTESSYRFERGADIEMLDMALDRASLLMLKIAGGLASGKIDVYPGKAAPRNITVGYEKINKVLGIEIKRQEIIEILRRLGFEVEADRDEIVLTPPSHRDDVQRDADVIEEIARLYGYGGIPTIIPKARISSPEKGKTDVLAVRETLRKEGYTEAVNFSFMNGKYLDVLNIPKEDARRRAVTLRNPLRMEDSLLRTMLAPSLIENFLYNFNRAIKDIRIFEISRVFEVSGGRLPLESLHAGGIYCVDRSHSLWKESAENFYVVKGVIESVFDGLKIPGLSFSPSAEPFLHPGKSADVFVGGGKVGFAGLLSPEVITKLDLKSKPEVLLFELDMYPVLEGRVDKISYKPIPKFPAVERDISMVLKEEITSESVIGLIRAYPSEYVEAVSVFDQYKGSNIQPHSKSLAFSVRYRAKERTLTEQEIEVLHNDILKHLTDKTGGEIRGA